MVEYPYSMSIGKMQSFIRAIGRDGVPDKVVTKTLEERGYKSTNDRTILPTLRFLGLIDEAGTPTQAWQELRNRENYPRVMASLVREAYADLFKAFEDANALSDKELNNFFTANSKSPERIVQAMVSVFKMLCSLSDFESETSKAKLLWMKISLQKTAWTLAQI